MKYVWSAAGLVMVASSIFLGKGNPAFRVLEVLLIRVSYLVNVNKINLKESLKRQQYTTYKRLDWNHFQSKLLMRGFVFECHSLRGFETSCMGGRSYNSPKKASTWEALDTNDIQ